LHQFGVGFIIIILSVFSCLFRELIRNYWKRSKKNLFIPWNEFWCKMFYGNGLYLLCTWLR